VTDCIVVGAGITGAAVAAHLARNGVSTLVLEAGDQPAYGATGSSGGLVRAYDPDPAIAELALASLVRYADPSEWASATAPLHKVGAVTLAAPEHVGAFESAAAALRAAGWPAEVVTGVNEVLGVVTNGAVALVEHGAGWVDPVRVTGDLLDQATAAGADVRFGTRVTGVVPATAADGNGPDAGVDVVIDSGAIHSARVVLLAVGAWVTELEFDSEVWATTIRTRSIQTALVQRPPGACAHATFIDLRTGGYGKPVDDQASLIGYPLLEWDVAPGAALPPDAAHQSRTAEVVADNLPWLQHSTMLKAIRSADAFADVGADVGAGVGDVLVATGVPGVWLCRPGSGGGVRVAPEIGRRTAQALTGALLSEP